MKNKQRPYSRQSTPKFLPPVRDLDEEEPAEALPLSDRDLKKFLLDGFLIISPRELSLRPEWHSEFCQYASHVSEGEGNPGNNVLARYPQLNEVFQDPRVKSVLSRILGKGYVMQSHRFMHKTSKGQLDQQWHKDSFFGYTRPLRHNQIRNVMLMYYPQKTTIPMGPTALRRGTAYTCIDPKRYKGVFPNEFNKGWNKESDIFMECEAGSLLLIHYDIIHRGSKNDERDRQMYKFQFSRMIEPSVDDTVPTFGVAKFEDVEIDTKPLSEGLYPVAESIWNWLHNIPFEPKKLPTTPVNLDSESELERMGAAYSLGLCNQYDTLMKRLVNNNEQICYNAAHGLVACRSQDAVRNLVKKVISSQGNLCTSMFVLSEWGPLVRQSIDEKTLDQLIDSMCKKDLDEITKVYVAEALGTIFCEYNDVNNSSLVTAIEYLCGNLKNLRLEEDRVCEQARYVSCFSLARIGPCAKSAVPFLKTSLKADRNRYVIGNILEACERIGTPEALLIELEYLKSTRWCFVTTKDNQF